MTDTEKASLVADFCAELRGLQQNSKHSRAELARRVSKTCGRSQLYAVLAGEIKRPPQWDRIVEPVVRVCTNGDEEAVSYWRHRHGALVNMYEANRQNQPVDPPETPVERARVVPAQLPADVNRFTGREQEIAELDRLLTGPADGGTTGQDSTAMVISAVSGTAGVGKTALALRWAHRVRGEFPDGQLYVNLRGYDPEQRMSAAAALAGFLRTLGVAGPDIPVEVDERAASYRSLLDGRRMLVVLDNAADVKQVRPLLPGTTSCVVVVTSRDALAGLVARNGARRIDLDLLPLDDAVALLRAVVGERVDAEPDAVAELAEHCARLPLALRIAAEQAAAGPATSLAALVAELADEQRRLDLLDAGGDPYSAIRGVFSWSYQYLPAEAAQTFRLLSLHPGPDLDQYAVAALIATNQDKAHRLLTQLSRAHLIELTSSGRYGMHDLLRVYAVGLATEEDSEDERRAALTRLFDHYLASAAAAMDAFIPADQHRRPRIPAPVTQTPPMVGPSEARAWLDTERATLTAACVHTASQGWPEHTIHLAAILSRYLDIGGHYGDAVVIHTLALQVARHTNDRDSAAHALADLSSTYWRQGLYAAAVDSGQQALTLFREIGNQAGQARALGNLGTVYQWQGRYEQAAEHQQLALTLFRDIGDRAGESRALANLGTVYARQGLYQQAAEHFLQALTLARKIGNAPGEAAALGNLGTLYERQGHYQRAAEHFQQALTLSREIGNRAGEARTLANLGVIYLRQGHYDHAVDHQWQALALFRDIGERAGEARTLDNLGTVYGRQGDHQQAIDHLQQALTLFREIGQRSGEVGALNALGEICHAAGELSGARIQRAAALDLATEIGDRHEQAHAHNGLARIHNAIGATGQARYHWCQALALYINLGVPEADAVRAHLAALDQPPNGD